MATKYSWKFKPKMRARSYGWQGSRKAMARLKEGVSEIKAIARKEPVLAGEGAVCLMERIWPAFEQIDTSSGALGVAIHRTLDALIPVLVDASADQRTRGKWLARLARAIDEDGVDYLAPVADRFGEIAVYPDLINQYADDRLDHIRMVWSQGERFGHVPGISICLSCLLEAGRYEDLMSLLGPKNHRLLNASPKVDIGAIAAKAHFVRFMVNRLILTQKYVTYAENCAPLNKSLRHGAGCALLQ